ncbi:HD-GYP domain-containing protein [Solirubrobacter phytolaccae]|uniref:HD-GYP domain-containing protein n=1 Tax=Solirubrobacter phytolaccae TaxID=1404360 RepID=A0A9X3SBT7_9ACTN|nr:HD-GYP domain-containing protein [Solirubrobacter phytolaccae]MDA0183906.1 HD-GYP domain-containing protein [Solirubrobacter phytolaccae]
MLSDVEARRPVGLPRRELLAEGVLAVLLLAGMLALALLAAPTHALNLPLALAYVAGYVVLHRLEFRMGDSVYVPTQLLLVPMLLLLPTPLVPLLVVAGTVTACVLPIVRGQRAPDRLLLAFNDAGFALTPAVVLVVLGAETADWSHWPIYLAALGAQFAVDHVRETIRSAAASGVPARVVVWELAQAHAVDAMLAPIGLLAAIAAADVPAAALLVLPLVGLMQHFSAEREAHVARTIELSRAYRGTAVLLSDLLEDSDAYTGQHTHEVVELSVRVAEKLGVDEDVRRETELGALLHDIGKIAIPDSIINKPGPLTDDEWTLMKTHTVVGQQMLDRVGGLLGNVGLVVRASHERFDGRGYPDGLIGVEIPLAARIIIVCDSFNAMTTTRPYRPAMAIVDAVEELRVCSGTQFDPNVAEALIEIVSEPGWQLTL